MLLGDATFPGWLEEILVGTCYAVRFSDSLLCVIDKQAGYLMISARLTPKSLSFDIHKLVH